MAGLDAAKLVKPQLWIGSVGVDADGGQQEGELCPIGLLERGGQVFSRLPVHPYGEVTQHPYVGMDYPLDGLPIGRCRYLASALGEHLGWGGKNHDQVVQERLIGVRHGVLSGLLQLEESRIVYGLSGVPSLDELSVLRCSVKDLFEQAF